MNLKRATSKGFTLVELMVAVALLGVVMTVIFALFSTTSDSLYEADSLADTVDRARFALERVSGDMRSAGSYGTPDARVDKWVEPKPDQSGGLPMFGLIPYAGWQNNTDIVDNDVLGAHGSDNDPPFSFDGIIIVGAIDFPQSFEVTNLVHNGDEVTGGVIPANERGLYKLMINDPFFTQTGAPPGLDLEDSDSSGIEHLTNHMPSRVMRVMDRDGYFQFSGVRPGFSAPGRDGLEFELSDPWAVRMNEDGDVSGGGIERGTADDEDVGYDAALLDAYWYYVDRDPRNPVNFRLVRERLDAGDVLRAADDGTLETANPGEQFPAVDQSGRTARQRVVITDRVVDFQVWFDCANDQGNLEGEQWRDTWVQDAGDGCAQGTVELGDARAAHIRLSLRTENERTDNPDSADFIFADEDGNFDPTQPMRYFNMYPDAEGSTRVVTVQNDIELTTFAMRNVDYRTGGQ